MNRKKLLIIFGIIFLIIFITYTYITTPDPRPYSESFKGKIKLLLYKNKTVDSYLKKFGIDYYHNFKFSDIYIGSQCTSVHVDWLKSYEYEFLPFSGKHKYFTTIIYDPEIDEVTTMCLNIPCLNDSGNDRCDFNVNYSDVYDMALEKKIKEKDFNGYGGINVSLIFDEEKKSYKWLASNDNSGCGVPRNYFHVDTDTGEATEVITEDRSGCID